MNNEWLNIMFYGWHLQAEGWRVRLSYNAYHKAENWPNGKFQVFTLF